MERKSSDQTLKVQLVCQFGRPVRGLSPYGDALKQALDRIGTVQLIATDYHSAYPSFLHPASTVQTKSRGDLSWYNPFSWLKVASARGQIMHIQHWAPPLSIYLWPLARLAKHSGKKLIITVHNPKPHETRNPFSYFEKGLLGTADMLLVHSNVGLDSLEKSIPGSSTGIRRIQHGMGASTSPATRCATDYAKLGLDPHARYILLFGNLRGYKGIEVLLAAWKMIELRHRNTHLLIAGRLWDGESGSFSKAIAKLLRTTPNARHLRNELAQAVAERRVILRQGFQSDQDIDALIRIADFCVFPYIRFSGQSGAACRAAEMGCPVLTSQVGALTELAIDDSWTFRPADVLQLAERLHQKLNDIEHLASARVQQHAIALQSSWDNVAAHHVAIYESLI